MAGFLFCTSYIREGVDGAGAKRWQQWIHYYKQKSVLMGIDRIFLIDDASPIDKIDLDVTIINASEPLPEELPAGVIMFRFSEHYGRESINVFQGWWRSFTFSVKIAEQYSFNKIIHVESDAYILSDKMFNHIHKLNAGWTAFWCPLRRFAESAIQVICADSIPNLEPYYNAGHNEWYKYRTADELPEKVLPFTQIEKRFTGDRYGAYLEGYPAHADYACQVHGLYKESS